MDALKHYEHGSCSLYQLHVPTFAGDTGYYHHSEAASSRAELNKQIPPVKRADNLPPSLLNTGLHKSHWYAISKKGGLITGEKHL